MDFEKSFSVDENLAEKGRWFPVGEGASVKIARTGNPKYRELLRSKLGVYEQSLQKRLLDDQEGDAVLIEVMARTILLDWKGFTDLDEEYPYSVANAITQMTKHVDFRDLVARNADNMQAYLKHQNDADRKNLPTESDGTLDGESKNDS